jgi:Leucine-rich repeat (LRR) protein
MSGNEPNALILRPAYGLSHPDSSGEKVLSRVVADALVLARENHVASTPVRFRIGSLDFNEGAYKQILIWADAVKKSPQVFVRLLEELKSSFWDGSSFLLENGSLKHVAFPPNLFTTKLDLSNVPGLTKLKCDENNLDKLNLSDASSLTELYCQGNRLKTLDISKTPDIQVLACGGNELSELDLSKVPNLEGLACGWNQLKKLNLNDKLYKLSCTNNNITELDVRTSPHLRFISCDPDVRIIKHEWQWFKG